jgi:hypothetical protein
MSPLNPFSVNVHSVLPAGRLVSLLHTGVVMNAVGRNSKCLIAAAAGAALVVVAANWATRLEAAPSYKAVSNSRSIRHEAIVDRSGEGDRLNFVAPTTRREVPTGYDAPFSPLAKLSPSNVVGRCLT